LSLKGEIEMIMFDSTRGRATSTPLTLICLAILAISGGCGTRQNSQMSETTAVTDSSPDPAAASTGSPDTAVPGSTSILIENVGLMTPESVLHDRTRDIYLVSNINGHPLDKDNNGFISRISPAGDIVRLKWIAGGVNGVTLNAPKGMAISGDVLYVNDIDAVRMFNVEAGAPAGEIAIEGASFLNDATVSSDGTVYVTDTGWGNGSDGFTNTGTDAIWAIRDGSARALIRDDSLHNPNGICATGADLVIVNAKGEVFHFSLSGDMSLPKTLPGASLDGVVMTGSGQLLISSWQTQSVYQGTMETGFTAIIENVPSPADIGYDATRNRVLIPVFLENKVRIDSLP
jgi:hypothetical protein